MTQSSGLRRICDSVLVQIREASTDLGHNRANIAFLTEPMYFREDIAALVELLEFIASSSIQSLIRDLAGPQYAQKPTLFHNTQYFHEQTIKDWDGAWHRDTQFIWTNPEAERARLSGGPAIHFRVAFAPDDRLEFVPGSHNRWDTPDELAIRKGARPNDPDMPDAVRIVLRPGDACVFHAWGIHRGTYRADPIRRTLDLIYGFGPVPPGPAVPPPTCFQNQVVLDSLSPDAREFFERFIAAYRSYWIGA